MPSAPVIELRPTRAGGSGGSEEPSPRANSRGLLLVVAGAQAAAFGASALASGFYDFSVWGALSLCSFALLIAVLIVQPLDLGRAGAVAVGGLGLLLAWSALSMLWAPSVDSAWTEVNRVAFYLVTFLLAASAIRTTRAAWTVVGIFTAASALVAVYLAVRLLTGSGTDLFVDFRLHEPVGYINGEAGFLLMAFWPLLALAERPIPPFLRGLALTLAALVAQLLVLTQSRAILPALLLSMLALVAFVPGRLRRCWALVVVSLGVVAGLPWLLDVYSQRHGRLTGLPSEGVLQAAGVAMVVTAVAAGIAWGVSSWLVGRATFPGKQRAGTVALGVMIAAGLVAIGLAAGNPFPHIKREYKDFVELRVEQNASQRFTRAGGHRYDLWRVAARQFRDHPVKGVGAGNYDATYYLERSNLDPVRQPHSLWLQMLGELGIVGLLAVALFVGAVLWGAFWRRSEILARADAGLLVAAGGVFLVWLTQTSVDWLYNLPGLTGMAVLCTAILTASPYAARARSRARRHVRQLVAVAAVAVLAILSASVGRQYAADWYLVRGTDAIARSPSDGLRDARRSLSLNSSNMRAHYLAAAAFARRNDYRRTRATLREAARIEPFNYVPWRLLGDAAQRRGDLAQAGRDYAQASRLNPLDPTLRDLARTVGRK